jgi:two-component system response regulator FlrC
VRLTDDARRALAEAAWPGNVRELANVLERSVILAEGDTIAAEDLAVWADVAGAVGDPAPGSAGTAPGADPGAGASSDLGGPTTVSELERAAIVRALAATGGNRRRAAAQLGIGLRTLYEKLKRYDLGS